MKFSSTLIGVLALLSSSAMAQNNQSVQHGLSGGHHHHEEGGCNLFEVPLNVRTNQSSAIVEGRVVASTSYWDASHHNIYTSHKIEVYKVLKGSSSMAFVEVVTPGGRVGMDLEVVEPSLGLRQGDVGVFFLKPSQVATNGLGFGTSFIGEPVASVQGLIEYDEIDGVAHDHFNRYTDIPREVLNEVEAIVQQPIASVQAYDIDLVSASVLRAVSITNFTPTTVTAGTGTTITINGSGFGATAGTVGFSDANDGGSSFFDVLPSQIVSWNDAQIVVEVPDRAGTGVIRVTENGGGSAGNSASSLSVSYAQLNVESDAISSGTFIAYTVQHIDDNGSGGYTWQKFTDFANDASASASFDRAFDTWVCNSGINWTIGSNTSTDAVASDGINIIRHDNGSELPNGTLGRCTSRYSGCFVNGNTDLNWFVTELDIVFDDGTNWNYSTAAPGFTEFDFESVAVHELGHGHQEGHVINTNEVMHFSISNGEQQRSLSANDLANGNAMMVRNTTTAVCGNSSMTAISCGVVPVADFSATPTTLCAGASVSFTDASTNTPTSWSWDFGDGGSSTSQNPSHTYNTAGTYTVTLTATNASGSDDEIKTNHITVNANPNLSSTGSTDESCATNDGTATVNPSAGSGNYSFQWDAGAGSQTTQTATALSAGTYNVVVTDNVTTCSANTNVTVNDGCGGVAPVADFSASSTSICAGGSVTFTDASTNTPTSWSWNFGDGGSSTSQNPSHTYSTAGNYTVTLTATNASGSDDEIKTNHITVNAAPDLSSTGSTDESCATNDGTATVNPSAGSGNYSFQWDAGAGSQTTQTATALTAGTYNVVVTDNVTTCSANTNVTVNDGCTTGLTQVTAADCGITLGHISEIFLCDPVAGATNYQWEFAPQGGGTTLYKTRNNGQTNMWMSAVAGIQNGTTYDIRVRAFVGGWGAYGPTCSITTPAGAVPSTQLSTSSCNISTSTLQLWVYADAVASATDYEFQFTPQGGGSAVSRLRGSANPNMLLSIVSGLQYGTTYDVQVRAYQGSAVGAYGSICTIQITGSNTTQVRAADCNTTVASFGTLFYCDAVSGATNYEWEFVPQGGGTTRTKTRNNAATNMWFNAVGQIQTTTTYDVRVRALVGGVWGSYGPVCTLTSGSSLTGNNGNNSIASSNTGSMNTNIATVGRMMVYPNPNQGNELMVALSDLSGHAGTARIEIFDIYGKKVHEERVAISGSDVQKMILFDQELQKGVYIVSVLAEGEQYTSKLVVR